MPEKQDREKPEKSGKSEKDQCMDTAWPCIRCDCLLGYVSMPKMDVVRLKYKDFYVYIGSPDWVQTICRQCAATNTIGDKDRPVQASSGATEESAPVRSA